LQKVLTRPKQIFLKVLNIGIKNAEICADFKFDEVAE
jgi:hypothetical protein